MEETLGDCRVQANAMFVIVDYFFGVNETAHKGDGVFAIQTTDATMLFEQAICLRKSTVAAGDQLEVAWNLIPKGLSR